MNIHLRIVSLVWLVLAFAPTNGVAGQKLSPKEQMLVGTWIWNSVDFSRHIKTRKADGTFVEYRFQVTDYAKPAVTYTLQGVWSLSKKHYSETYTAISFERGRKVVGRTERMDVVSQSADTFYYFSSDSAPINERKLAPAEAADVLREPFRYLTADVRTKYAIEAH